MKITLEVPDKFSGEVQSAVDGLRNSDGEIAKLNAVCFWLIKLCTDTNAEKGTFAQTNVFRHEKNLGSWEIKVEKINQPRI